MATTKKAKQIFSLKNFIVLLVSVGVLVALSFWAGRMSKAAILPVPVASWDQLVAMSAGMAPATRQYSNGKVVSMTFCPTGNYALTKRVNVYQVNSKLYPIDKQTIKNGNIYAGVGNAYGYSPQQAGTIIKTFCNEKAQGKW